MLVAGDTAPGLSGIGYCDSVARYLGCPVATIAGNHEFYGEELYHLTERLHFAAQGTDGRVTFLESARADFDLHDRHIAVLGATLWTDYGLHGDSNAGRFHADMRLNDHRRIRFNDGRFLPENALALHRATREWLAIEVPRARREADMVIVMTHHAPIEEAIPPQYHGDDLSPAFASDMRREIESWQPDLWVWGHTHYSMRMEIGRTQLVSAQRGYIGHERGAEDFVPAIVEIGGASS